MAVYKLSLLSRVPSSGCHKGVLSAVHTMKWDLLKLEPARILCREQYTGRQVRANLVTMEIALKDRPDHATTIDVLASTGLVGGPAEQYARLQVDCLIHHIDYTLRPTRL